MATTTAETNARALIRAMQASQPLNGLTAADCGPWQDVMAEATRAYEQSGTEVAMRVVAAAPGLLRLASEEQPPADPWQTSDLLPDLPSYARLTPAQERQALESNEYLNTYVEYSRAVVPMLPASFHESAALWLGAVAIARRLSLNMPFDTVYPNLYLLWIAPTTIYNKSTALKIPRRLLEQVMPHLRLTSEFSREALLESLAGREVSNQAELGFTEKDHIRFQLAKKFAARRAIMLDEASSLFAGLKREYNTGMAELFMYLYDCTDYERTTRTGGLVIVKKPYLNFLGATTPIMLKQADNIRLWHSGLWPRFGFLLPHTRPKRLITVAHKPNEPALLTEQLDKLANHYLPIPDSPFDFPDARCAILPAEILEQFSEYRRALVEGILMGNDRPPDELHGPYGRLPTSALKVAIILAALDWDGAGNVPTIRPAHWYRGQMIAENWRKNTHFLYRELNGAAELDNLEQKILGAVVREIARNGECGRREVYRNLNKKAEEVYPLIDSMIEAGLLKENRPEGRRKLILEPGDGLPVGFVSKA